MAEPIPPTPAPAPAPTPAPAPAPTPAPAPAPPHATGGTSAGAGTTTPVKINQPDIDPQDKKVLCAALCQCDKAPATGADGRQLKQACVAKTLKEVDQQMAHRSPYKQELNYDMTKNPPAPIMDKQVPTKGHDWLPGWIDKWWNQPDAQGAQRPPFTPGTGQIRRPDVVIVKDPTKPPTQDNIKQIVEMKFPPDQISDKQKLAYEDIAGDPKKLKTLQPSDCNCDQSEPEAPKVPSQEIGIVATLLSIILAVISRGKIRPPTSPI
jgi:VRR-NUC domain